MRRSPDVQRRMRYGPILPAEEVRERWLARPMIAAIASDRLPDWVLDLGLAFLLFQLVRAA